MNLARLVAQYCTGLVGQRGCRRDCRPEIRRCGRPSDLSRLCGYGGPIGSGRLGGCGRLGRCGIRTDGRRGARTDRPDGPLVALFDDRAQHRVQNRIQQRRKQTGGCDQREHRRRDEHVGDVARGAVGLVRGVPDVPGIVEIDVEVPEDVRARHPHRRVGHRQQVGWVGRPVGPPVVLADHLRALVGRVGRQGCGRAAAEVVLRIADRHPGQAGWVRRGSRVGCPSPQGRIDHLAALAVAEQGDRAGGVGQCPDRTDDAVRALLVEVLPEGPCGVVDGLAPVRRVTEVAAQLQLGEGDEVLEAGQSSFEGEDGGGQGC